jgi:hypothetical protein
MPEEATMFQRIVSRVRALARGRRAAALHSVVMGHTEDDETVVDRNRFLEMAVVA